MAKKVAAKARFSEEAAKVFATNASSRMVARSVLSSRETKCENSTAKRFRVGRLMFRTEAAHSK